MHRAFFVVAAAALCPISMQFLLAWLLPPHVYGVFIVAYNLPVIASFLAGGGLATLTPRRVVESLIAKDMAGAARFTWNASAIAFGLSLPLSAVAFAIYASGVAGDFGSAFACAGGAVPFTAARRVLRRALVGAGCPGFGAIVEDAAAPILVIFLLLVFNASEDVLWLLVFAVIISTAIGAGKIMRILGRPARSDLTLSVPHGDRSALVATIGGTAYLTLTRLDSVAGPFLLEPSVLAVMSVACRIGGGYLMLGFIIANVYSSRIVTMSVNKDLRGLRKFFFLQALLQGFALSALSALLLVASVFFTLDASNALGSGLHHFLLISPALVVAGALSPAASFLPISGKITEFAFTCTLVLLFTIPLSVAALEVFTIQAYLFLWSGALILLHLWQTVLLFRGQGDIGSGISARYNV